jgi:threonine/homoserine efflux transporter RhtA
MITATIATLYFNIVNIGKLKVLYKACWQEKKMWLAVMLTILVMWCCTMIGPGLIGASLYNFLYFSFLGAIGFLSLSIIAWYKNRSKFYFGLGLILLIIIAIIDQIVNADNKISILGIGLGLLGGLVTFIYFKQSQALVNRIQLKATQILAVRFYLTIIGLFVIIPKENFKFLLAMNTTLILLALAAISLIAPLYCQQKALEKISSEQNAIILSLIPVVTAFIQLIVFHNVNYKFILIYFIYFTIILVSYFFSKFKTRVLEE